MLIIISIFFLVMLLSAIKVSMEPVYKKVLFLYIFFVCTILLISSANPLGLYDVSEKTYFYLLASIASFAVSFILMSKRTQVSYEPNTLVYKEEWFLKSKAVNGVFLGVLAVVVAYKFKYDAVIRNLKPGQYRIARFTNLFGSAFEALFFNYLVSGMALIATIIFAVLIVEKEYKNLLVYTCGSTVLVYSLIGYGRMIYLATMIYLMFSLLIINNLKELFNIKMILKAGAILSLVLLFCIALVYFRTAEDYYSFSANIKNAFVMQIRQLIEYFTIGMRLLDDFLKNGFELFPKHTYGRATFAGIEEIILYPAKGLGAEIDSFNNIIPIETQVMKQVGENTTANAFYTCVMNYYLDFGAPGVIIFSGLHGCLISMAAAAYIRRRDFFSLLLLNYVFYHLLFSIVMWDYQSGTYVFVLAILIVTVYLTGRKGSEEDNK